MACFWCLCWADWQCDGKLQHISLAARINARRGQGENLIIIPDRTEGDEDGDSREG